MVVMKSIMTASTLLIYYLIYIYIYIYIYIGYKFSTNKFYYIENAYIITNFITILL
jgi:hypothetical protein